jgi:hypothetical protein
VTAAAAGSGQTWIARLTPSASSSVAALLGMPLGLDVWERHPGYLVVAAPASCLAEVERRRLADVDRRATQEQYVAQTVARAQTPREG